MAKTILIIDDEEDIITLIKARLEMNNYNVLTAYNGKQGYELALASAPDLLIIDIEMPEMNGYTFIEKCKLHKDLSNIPYIVLTAHPQLEYPLKNQGVENFMTKPFNAEEFLQKIGSLLR